VLKDQHINIPNFNSLISEALISSSILVLFIDEDGRFVQLEISNVVKSKYISLITIILNFSDYLVSIIFEIV
jgi:hypothetical protein